MISWIMVSGLDKKKKMIQIQERHTNKREKEKSSHEKSIHGEKVEKERDKDKEEERKWKPDQVYVSQPTHSFNNFHNNLI